MIVSGWVLALVLALVPVLAMVLILVSVPELGVLVVLVSTWVHVLMVLVEVKPKQFCLPSPSQGLLQRLPSLLSAASGYDQLPKSS